MLVKDWMTRHVITIGSEDSLQRAASLMADYEVSMLPVTVRRDDASALSRRLP